MYGINGIHMVLYNNTYYLLIRTEQHTVNIFWFHKTPKLLSNSYIFVFDTRITVNVLHHFIVKISDSQPRCGGRNSKVSH